MKAKQHKTPTEKFVENMLKLFREFEQEERSERIKKGLARLKQSKAI